MEPQFVKTKRANKVWRKVSASLRSLIPGFLLILCISGVGFAEVQIAQGQEVAPPEEKEPVAAADSVVRKSSVVTSEEKVAKVFEETQHSVVYVRVKKSPRRIKATSPDELAEMFPRIDLSGLHSSYVGTGVIIDKSGYILTSNFLIEDSQEIRIEVSKADRSSGGEYVGQVVGRDAVTGLAVIKIDPDFDLIEVKIGNSSGLRIGQWMIAVGARSEFEKTVAFGVVGGLGQSAKAAESRYRNYIATDALSDPGNAGGPLLNIDGEVVGISSAFRFQQTGIGLAIPIDEAMEVYRQLVEHGEVIRGFLGVSILDLGEALAAALEVPDGKGVLVSQVFPDTPAKKAGIHNGDVIREIDGHKVENTRTVQDAISHKKPGTEVTIKLLRKGQGKDFTIELTKYPERIGATKPSRKKENLLGLSVGEIPKDSPASRKNGVIVEKIEKSGPAEQGGLIEGDIILEIDMHDVNNTKDFKKAVRELAPDSWVSFYILRGDQTLYRAVKIPRN